MRGNGEFEYYTPRQYVEAARHVLGGIDLDPASCEQAQRIVRAKNFYTIETNGLDKPWAGRVWLNAPFSRGLVTDFVNKLLDEIDAGRVTAAVMLTNNCTDTGWFDAAMRVATSICFTHGRIEFDVPTGRPANAVPQGQSFFYFGNDPSKFEETFCEFGGCWRPSRLYADRRADIRHEENLMMLGEPA